MKPIIRLARSATEHFVGKIGERCKLEVVISRLDPEDYCCHSFFLSDERNKGLDYGRFPNLEILLFVIPLDDREDIGGDPFMGFVAVDHSKNIAAVKQGCMNRNYLECSTAWIARAYVMEACLLDVESAFEVASAYLENQDFGENFDSIKGLDSWLTCSEYERKLANKL